MIFGWPLAWMALNGAAAPVKASTAAAAPVPLELTVKTAGAVGPSWKAPARINWPLLTTSINAVADDTPNKGVVAVVVSGTWKLICVGAAKKSGAATPSMNTCTPASVVGNGWVVAIAVVLVRSWPKSDAISPGDSVGSKLAADVAAIKRGVVESANPVFIVAKKSVDCAK